MKTFKTFYFTKLASEHFGETMGIIINTLDKYGPMKYSDIIKYTSFDNLKFLEIAITLGIKHQIIQYKITKLFNEDKKLIRQKKIIYLNHQALLGREYIPELMVTQYQYKHIFEYGLKNGIFGIKNLITDQLNEKQIENYINELLDKAFIQVVQINYSEEKQEVIKKDIKNKIDKKTQKLIKKQQDNKQESVTTQSLLQFNWKGIMEFIKHKTQQEIIQKIYQFTNFKDEIYTNKIMKELKENLEQRWISDKFTPKHARIVNLLRIKHQSLDEKQICDLALLDYTDSNTILQELLCDTLIKSEVIKIGDKEKQVYLFDQQLINEQLQLNFYKGLLNCKDKKLYFGILHQLNLIE